MNSEQFNNSYSNILYNEESGSKATPSSMERDGEREGGRAVRVKLGSGIGL